MSRIFAALLLTVSLLVGTDGLDGIELGSAPSFQQMFSMSADVSGGGERGDKSGRPAHICTQLTCTQALSVPERLVLIREAQEPPRLSPSNDRGLLSTALQQDPPVPRAWIG
jgi:hypothetical protein